MEVTTPVRERVGTHREKNKGREELRTGKQGERDGRERTGKERERERERDRSGGREIESDATVLRLRRFEAAVSRRSIHIVG